MESLEADAKKYFQKLDGTIRYNQKRLADNQVPDKIKHIIKLELEMLEFMARFAVEALEKRGINVT